MNHAKPFWTEGPDHNFDPPLAIPISLSTALIPDLPSSAYYIPSFITTTEENIILHHINNAPLPTWKTLSHRRLQAYPSTLSNSNVLLAAPLPPWLEMPIVPRILSMGWGISEEESDADLVKGALDSRESRDRGQVTIFNGSPHGSPNHCLVNEYQPGQGIYPHEDGSAYWPVVCTV